MASPQALFVPASRPWTVPTSVSAYSRAALSTRELSIATSTGHVRRSWRLSDRNFS